MIKSKYIIIYSSWKQNWHMLMNLYGLCVFVSVFFINEEI